MHDGTALDRIADCGIVAVIRGVDADDAVDVAEALLAGGVTAVEVTADTPGVTDAIADVADAVGDEAAVGAGTVLDAGTAAAAIRAGAEFVVAPTLDRGVVEACNRHGAAVAPGAMTPTEAVEAREAGADLVKVYPASTVGPGHVAAMRGPLPHVPLLPTGGVDLDNVADFIDAGAAAVGVGSALVDADAVAAGEYGRLTERAAAFRTAIDGARSSNGE